MSLSELSEVLNPYEGPNLAHKRFRQEFKYLNASYYLIVSGKDEMRKHVKSKMAEAERLTGKTHVTDGYVLVTNVPSPTQFQGIVVAKSDLEHVADDFDGFINLLNRHSVIAAHRAIVDFAINLLIELDGKNRINLTKAIKEDLHQRRLQPSKLAEQFRKIDEPLHEDPIQLKRLHILGELRNMLEHNEGKATKEYVHLLGDDKLSIGNPIQVTGKDVGEAFALVNSTATSLNKRVVNRFHL